MSLNTAKRTVIRILFDADRKQWVGVTPADENGQYTVVFAGHSKDECVNRARDQLKENWRGYDVLGQLVIHKKNGQIQEERTWGRDPKRSVG